MDISFFHTLPACAQNHYLAGYVTSQQVVRSWLNCLTLCVLSEICGSVNVWENPVNKRNVTCQLNWSIGIDCSDLQAAPGVRYDTQIKIIYRKKTHKSQSRVQYFFSNFSLNLYMFEDRQDNALGNIHLSICFCVCQYVCSNSSVEQTRSIIS